jgi:hypothetical protein
MHDLKRQSAPGFSEFMSSFLLLMFRVQDVCYISLYEGSSPDAGLLCCGFCTRKFTMQGSQCRGRNRKKSLLWLVLKRFPTKPVH